MRRNSGKFIPNPAEIAKAFPGLFRHDRLAKAMFAAGLNPKSLARASRRARFGTVSADTVMRAMDGDCGTIKKLWIMADIAGIPFSELFDFDPRESEFDRAVSLPTRSSVRSQGRLSVGGASAR